MTAVAFLAAWSVAGLAFALMFGHALPQAGEPLISFQINEAQCELLAAGRGAARSQGELSRRVAVGRRGRAESRTAGTEETKEGRVRMSHVKHRTASRWDRVGGAK